MKGVAVSLLCVGMCLPAGARGQAPDVSMREVDVHGSPTRVLTVGLAGRGQDEAILLLSHGGGGAPIESWGEWLSMISSLAPVVTYDRPGIGESPFDGIDPTPARVVEHLHELLDVLEVAPPYILVGWSWGGPLIRYYAGQHPEDVVGMVYLDPTDMTATSAEAAGASNPEELAEIWAELDSVRATRSLPPGRAAELRVITRFNRSTVADRNLPDDPDVPTSVVLATLPPSIPANAPSYVTEDWYEKMYARRVRQFGEWLGGRSNTTLFVATDSGHLVYRDAPALALEAVRRVVVAARASR